MEGVKAYIDDLIVYSENWETHVFTLKALFKRFRGTKLTVNLVRSEIGHAILAFLGHSV